MKKVMPSLLNQEQTTGIDGYYLGSKPSLVVFRPDKTRLDPKPSQELWNHSPDGFNWGYGGSGPAQLSLAILLDRGCTGQVAVRLHQRFKWDFVSKMADHWSISEQAFDEWIEEHKKELPRYCFEQEDDGDAI